MATITIDLCPYDVEITPAGVRILDCGGSILSRLDNRCFKTGNRFSADHCYTRVGNQGCYVFYESDDDEDGIGDSVVFEPMRGFTTPEFDEVVEWVRVNFDAIQSIGWELLKTPEQARKAGGA